MELFQNDIINISEIVTVNMYELTAEDIKQKPLNRYGVNLPTYELVFFVSGVNETHFDGVVINDRPGVLRFLPKNHKTGEYYSRGFEPGVCIDIYFDTSSPMPDRAIGFKNMDFLKDDFEKIYNLWCNKKTGYYFRSMKVLYDIIEKINSHKEGYITNAQKEKIDAAYSYIIEHYRDREFDYKQLCSVSNLSYSYFKELFIAAYKMPPSRLVSKLKIEYAKELLITRRYSITEIAELCGFDNVYYFSTVFKKWVGISPKNYVSG